jgi:hypothetical protein
LSSADSRSVVITNTCLPLEGIGAEEREERQLKIFIVELNVQTGDLEKIAAQDQSSQVLSVNWDQKTNELSLKMVTPNGGPSDVYFQKKPSLADLLFIDPTKVASGWARTPFLNEVWLGRDPGLKISQKIKCSNNVDT